MERSSYHKLFVKSKILKYKSIVTVESKRLLKKQRVSLRCVYVWGVNLKWPNIQIALYERTRQSTWLDAVMTPVDKERVNFCALKLLFFDGVQQQQITKKNLEMILPMLLISFFQNIGWRRKTNALCMVFCNRSSRSSSRMWMIERGCLDSTANVFAHSFCLEEKGLFLAITYRQYATHTWRLRMYMNSAHSCFLAKDLCPEILEQVGHKLGEDTGMEKFVIMYCLDLWWLGHERATAWLCHVGVVNMN